MTPTLDREWVRSAVETSAEDHFAPDRAPNGHFRAGRDPEIIRAEWPWIMLAQRLAWHHGIDGALTRLLRLSTAREAAGRKAPAVAG